MRRVAGIAVLTLGLATLGLAPLGLALVPTAALAQAEDSEDSSGSLVVQAMHAAEDSLGADASVAVARAIDRGYDGVQVVEGLFDGAVATDGTITEDDDPLPPFGEPSNLIEGDGVAVVPAGFTLPRGGSGEEIALEALETGLAKTTKQLDKKYDLKARSERQGVVELGSFTMAVMLAARMEGYTPEQILLDGLLGGGLRIQPFRGGVEILDEQGEVIEPGVEEVSEEQAESADVIDAFVLDTVEMIGGIDPHTAAQTPFAPQYKVDIEIIGGDDYSLRITGDGVLGTPRDRDQRRFVVGKGEGTLEFSSACDVGGGEPHPYTVDGPVRFGMSGQAEGGSAKLRLALTDANLAVVGDDSLCVDVVRDTARFVTSMAFVPAELKLRIGETATVEGSLGGDPMGLEITIRA